MERERDMERGEKERELSRPAMNGERRETLCAAAGGAKEKDKPG